MRIPKSLETLVDHGIIQRVLRPLMSGKEAQIYLVISNDEPCAAKIYKDAQNRTFKNRADYIEGRKVRNTRDQRAMNKGTKYGKSKDEDTWKSTEVDMIRRLHDAGVRVPIPQTFIDGVFVMELVTDVDGNPAPRLGDLEFSPEEAREVFDRLVREAQLMLCAGVVHGDLSEFNVLLAEDGPVVIDFPQAVHAAGNLNARTLLLRDVNNLHRFLARWAPETRRRPFAEEMWALYESNQLTPDTKLTGQFRGSRGPVDTNEVLSLIADANRDEAQRRRVAGKSTAGLETEAAPMVMRRREVIVTKPPSRGGPSGASGANPRRGQPPSVRGKAEAPSRRPAQRGPRVDAKPAPKRGAGAPVSTYVSPEARKSKANVLQLTPREATPRAHGNGPAPKSGAQGLQPQGHSPSTSSGATRRRRRSRRRTSQ